MAKPNGLNLSAVDFKRELQMLIFQDSLRKYLELIGKERFRESLTPDVLADGFNEFNVEVGSSELAVCDDVALEHFRIGKFFDSAGKELLEFIKCILTDRKTCSHRVTAEFQDQPRTQFADTIQCIAQMNAGNRAPRAFKHMLAVFFRRSKRNDRAISLFFDAGGY